MGRVREVIRLISNWGPEPYTRVRVRSSAVPTTKYASASDFDPCNYAMLGFQRLLWISQFKIPHTFTMSVPHIDLGPED